MIKDVWDKLENGEMILNTDNRKESLHIQKHIIA